MVKRRPSERYKTADEVLADLLPLTAPPPHELESTTIDGKGIAAAAIATALAAPPPPAVAAPAPAAPVAAAQPTPTPPSSDIRISVTGPSSAPPRRGVPPAVTIGLVAAALVGGVLLGPRVLQQAPPAAPAVTPVESAGPAATPAPSATGAPAASATATADPVASAAPAGSAAPMAAAADAGAAARADAGVAATADAGATPVKAAPVRIPGPMPKPLEAVPKVESNPL